jgi:HK97 family phage prohead protease
VYGIADSQNDIIKKGAFKSSENHQVKLLWQHDVTKPIGIVKFIEEDEYGLKVEAEINNKITAGAEATELIKQKAICGLSVGFTIRSSDYDRQGARVIDDAELMEISIVTFPANTRAQINKIKDSETQSGSLEELEKLIEQLENY